MDLGVEKLTPACLPLLLLNELHSTLRSEKIFIFEFMKKYFFIFEFQYFQWSNANYHVIHNFKTNYAYYIVLFLIKYEKPNLTNICLIQIINLYFYHIVLYLCLFQDIF